MADSAVVNIIEAAIVSKSV